MIQYTCVKITTFNIYTYMNSSYDLLTSKNNSKINFECITTSNDQYTHQPTSTSNIPYTCMNVANMHHTRMKSYDNFLAPIVCS